MVLSIFGAAGNSQRLIDNTKAGFFPEKTLYFEHQ